MAIADSVTRAVLRCTIKDSLATTGPIKLQVGDPPMANAMFRRISEVDLVADPAFGLDADQVYNGNRVVAPLRQSAGLTEEMWFGHGMKGYPPVEGDFMELVSGSNHTGERLQLAGDVIGTKDNNDVCSCDSRASLQQSIHVDAESQCSGSAAILRLSSEQTVNPVEESTC